MVGDGRVTPFEVRPCALIRSPWTVARRAVCAGDNPHPLRPIRTGLNPRDDGPVFQFASNLEFVVLHALMI